MARSRCFTRKEPPLKDTARKTTRRQEATATTPQLALAAMIDARATLHDAIVSAGMTVLGAMLEEERAKLCGPRYAHQPERTARRSGHADGELALGGQRVRVRRPRVHGVDGREVKLETWRQFAEADPLTPRAVEQMELGVSTRKYVRSIQPAPPWLAARGTSRSACTPASTSPRTTTSGASASVAPGVLAGASAPAPRWQRVLPREEGEPRPGDRARDDAHRDVGAPRRHGAPSEVPAAALAMACSRRAIGGASAWCRGLLQPAPPRARRCCRSCPRERRRARQQRPGLRMTPATAARPSSSTSSRVSRPLR